MHKWHSVLDICPWQNQCIFFLSLTQLFSLHQYDTYVCCNTLPILSASLYFRNLACLHCLRPQVFFHPRCWVVYKKFYQVTEAFNWFLKIILFTIIGYYSYKLFPMYVSHCFTSTMAIFNAVFNATIVFEFWNEQIYIGTESILLVSSILLNNESEVTDAYSEPCQTSTIECLTKNVHGL